LKNSKCSDPAD
ncbi:unnamed protein product, partial [Allacma fusca]